MLEAGNRDVMFGMSATSPHVESCSFGQSIHCSPRCVLLWLTFEIGCSVSRTSYFASCRRASRVALAHSQRSSLRWILSSMLGSRDTGDTIHGERSGLRARVIPTFFTNCIMWGLYVFFRLAIAVSSSTCLSLMLAEVIFRCATVASVDRRLPCVVREVRIISWFLQFRYRLLSFSEARARLSMICCM